MGKHKHANFAFASGEMSSEEFTAFLAAIFRWLIQYSVDGSIHYQFIDWRHLQEMLTADSQYHELKNMVVWAKTNAGLGTFYRSQHELIFVYQNGSAKPINNFLLGETGRWRSNLWVHAGCNTFRAGRDEDLAAHVTVKPLSLIADAIRDCSKRGGIVLDPFGGSGVTLLAAEKTGRRARLIEIDPLYVDVTIRRWEEQTGKQAVLVETGATFPEVREARLGTEEEGGDDE